jgi:omega-6 fatty acid desaturase (delta-12 desaturase)
MITSPGAANGGRALPTWYKALAHYEKPDRRKALWQLCNTFLPYIALWILMVCLLKKGIAYGWVLPLTVVAAGLLVRVFIFFHDCGHGSFLPSRQANRIVGYLCGLLVFTSFEDWRLGHAGHHATAEDLDRRGTGDIWTLTVEEYRAASKGRRLAYRLFRHPCVLFLLGPLVLFLVLQRFAGKTTGKRERRSILWTNLGILAMVILGGLTLGLRTYLLIQLPIIALAATLGVWLFYVQHQYEGVYWARHPEWDPIRAALEGSSYYRLPKVLQWFSGNIGFHHIHHLRPRIPNYHLQRCYEEVPELQAVEMLTLRTSLKSMFLHLWDETNQKLVGFRALNTSRK